MKCDRHIFMFFGTGISRQTAPGAAIIHFFGGIHEIYFPYILAKPSLILAGVGLTATPGSIVASLTLKFSKQDDESDLNDATAKMEKMKGKRSRVSDQLTNEEQEAQE